MKSLNLPLRIMLALVLSVIAFQAQQVIAAHLQITPDSYVWYGGSTSTFDQGYVRVLSNKSTLGSLLEVASPTYNGPNLAPKQDGIRIWMPAGDPKSGESNALVEVSDPNSPIGWSFGFTGKCSPWQSAQYSLGIMVGCK